MRYRFGSVPAAALAAAALLSGGCSSGAGTAQPQVEKHDLTVASVPVADAAALYIAQQRGLFQAAGLHVKIVPVVTGAAAIAGQLSGKYDVVLGNYVSFILADVHGGKFRVLAPAASVSPNESMLLIPPDSRIQNVAQLKGKTIGVNALNNIGTLLVTSLLNANGLDLQADHIRFKAIPFREMTHALQKHQVQAAWMVEPFVTNAEMTGAQPLADTNAGATQNLPIAGYMVTQSWEQKYPGTAAAFRRSLLEGQRIASASRRAVWRGVEAFTKIPPSTAELIALPGYPLAIQALSLQRIADLMLFYNMISHSYDTAQMLR